MNSTTINFITEFMQTMLSRTQTSPPRCSARLPSNRLTQAQGAQVAGQGASQNASPAAFPVVSPRTNAAFSSSTHLTRASLKAVAATFPDVAATTLSNSADANSKIGGLTLNPEVTGTSEMPTASKKIVKVSGSTSSLAKCDWLSVGACVFNSASNQPSLVLCQVTNCNLMVHHACQGKRENRGPGRKMGGCMKLCIGQHPFAKLLAVPERQVVGATSELMTFISNDVQTILTQYSSDEEETAVKVSV
jgi:hypothetical protein